MTGENVVEIGTCGFCGHPEERYEESITLYGCPTPGCQCLVHGLPKGNEESEPISWIMGDDLKTLCELGERFEAIEKKRRTLDNDVKAFRTRLEHLLSNFKAWCDPMNEVESDALLESDAGLLFRACYVTTDEHHGFVHVTEDGAVRVEISKASS